MNPIGRWAVLCAIVACGSAQAEPEHPGEPAEVVAVEDPALHARVARCEPLVYVEPAPTDHDERGPHVRAASGLARLGDGLLIAQDDMSVLAIRHPDGGLTTRALPSRDGHHSFEAAHGNVHRKPDLEACASLPDGRVLCFGSGTLAERSWIALVDRELEVTWTDAEAFYATLRLESFCGPELNLEGAVVLGDRLRLFHRGNGAGAQRHSAYADLDLAAFQGWLEGSGPVPTPLAIQPVNLGSEEGVAYGFTGATAFADQAIVFLAGAEASPSVLEDGRVVGVRIGVMDQEGVRITAIEEAEGGRSTLKLEGLVLDSARPGWAWAVSDVDATDTPASLCEIQLSGPWMGAPAS
ncbi:MAG: hypothetical protein JJ863_37285 [Deltaproteobacteria bacterium]|nr:hypothetical protein [Deltaproteobacteria bacterium]